MTDQGNIGPQPAVDPELAGPLNALKGAVPGGMPSLSAGLLPLIRSGFPGIPGEPAEHFSRGGAFDVQNIIAESASSDHGVPLLVCTPARSEPAGCVVYLHGGGMVLGSNVNGVDEFLDYAEELRLAVVSVDYRLAPEHPHPAPVEDCFLGLVWAAQHAESLRVPRGRLIVAGESAGGGLAAATALLARDRGLEGIAGQMLLSPMLDHRSDSLSMRQLGDAGMWDRESNIFGWSSLLGALTSAEVPSYASPSRADDLAGLPSSFIDVGGADAFRDEAVDYATRISQAGGLVDLHLWAGAFHGFDGIAPSAGVSRAARDTRRQWLSRLLSSFDLSVLSTPVKESA